MKRILQISIAMGLLVLLTNYGCATRPTEQIDRAEMAMNQAKEQRAEEFSPTEWRNGMTAWESAQEALDEKRYSEASTYLLKATGQFGKARDLAKGKRDELLREIQGLQKTIDIRYQSLKAAAAAARLAPKAKKELEASFSDIEQAIVKLKSQIEQGDYTPAKYTAQTTLRKVYEAEQTLPPGR